MDYLPQTRGRITATRRIAAAGLLLSGLLLLSATGASGEPDPKELIRSAMEHWRGVTSYSRMTMTVHRPDWERAFSMRAWTEGDKLSLVRVVEPKRDAGNATLVRDNDMWTYSPKINRILKLPSSMMSQGWMGSDFSNRDVSKSTDIVDDYDHRLLATESRDGHLVYTVESIPHEDAAVVWGREVAVIRDDYVLLRHDFRDQDDILVKQMEAAEIRLMDGRPVASRLTMRQIESPGEWTEMTVDEIDFDIDIPPGLFTLSNLRNPRQ